MAAPERKLGNVATKVLLENERVRIWEMRLAPGESSDVHRHDLDHIIVLIDGDRIAAEPEPDTRGPYKDYLDAKVVPGTTVYVKKGGIETAINVGERPYYEILIELK